MLIDSIASVTDNRIEIVDSGLKGGSNKFPIRSDISPMRVSLHVPYASNDERIQANIGKIDINGNFDRYALEKNNHNSSNVIPMPTPTSLYTIENSSKMFINRNVDNRDIPFHAK